MTSNRLLIAALTLAALSTAGSLRADTIYLTDGKTLDDVTVAEETLAGVLYKPKGKSSTTSVSPDKVLRIDYSRKPRLVDEADTMAEEGAVLDAIDGLKQFADGALSGTKVREKWAPAYALRRVMDLNMTIGNLPGVIAAADKLIEGTPDSRHVPSAYLTKAEAQRYLGKEQDALATLDDFADVIEEKGLSERWRLENQLARILADPSVTGADKRSRLADVVNAAGDDHPVVKNRAYVAEGESYLEESSPDYDAALEAFENIIDDPSADGATLAGAYTGKGDCLYLRAASKLQRQGLDEELSSQLRDAVKSYLRVIVVHKDQSRYVPKALMYAGRVFDLFDTDEARSNARQMYRRLVSDYPASNWAEDAKKFL